MHQFAHGFPKNSPPDPLVGEGVSPSTLSTSLFAASGGSCSTPSAVHFQNLSDAHATTGFTLAGIGSDKLVNIIHSPFCSVVVNDYFRPFIFTFIMYFSAVMLCGNKNDILPTFRNVWYQRLFTEKSKRTWIDISLLGIKKRQWKNTSIVSNCST